MSTWHQRQRKARLYHESKWTVVIDPPEQMTCLILFETLSEADEFVKRNKDRHGYEHMYILGPWKDVT